MSKPNYSSSAPAGWYPDAHDESQEQFWDGSEWTQQRRPAATAEAPAAAPLSVGRPGPASNGDPTNTKLGMLERRITDTGHKRLPDVVDPAETIEYVLAGQARLGQSLKGAAVALTDRQLLVVGRKSEHSLTPEMIAAVTHDLESPDSHKLTIDWEHGPLELKMLVPAERAEVVANELARRAGVELQHGPGLQAKRAHEDHEAQRVATNQAIAAGTHEFRTADAFAAQEVGKLRKRVKQALAENVADDEVIRVVIRGVNGQAIVGSDSRAFVAKPGWMAGATLGIEITSFNYRNLAGVQVHKGMVSGAVLLQSYGQAGQRTNYWKNGDDDPHKAPNAIPVASEWELVKRGAATLRELIDQAHAPAEPAPSVPPSGADSIADEIRKLGELKESGLLSDDEFATAKKRLLGSESASPGQQSS